MAKKKKQQQLATEPQPIGHAAKRERRKRIAQAILDGESQESVALRFGVGYGYVAECCRGHGVECPQEGGEGE